MESDEEKREQGEQGEEAEGEKQCRTQGQDIGSERAEMEGEDH